MRRRTIIAIAIAASLCFGVTAFWSAQTTLRDGETDANVVSDAGAKTGQNMKEKKGGNKIVRALTSPSRPSRRLFGGGNDEGKLTRLSENAMERFESTPASVVRDSR